jgi:hypothetical protein
MLLLALKPDWILVLTLASLLKPDTKFTKEVYSKYIYQLASLLWMVFLVWKVKYYSKELQKYYTLNLKLIFNARLLWQKFEYLQHEIYYSIIYFQDNCNVKIYMDRTTS